MKNILILFGGNSYEHEISCKSVNFIINNIDKKKYNLNLVGINKDNNWYKVTNTPIKENWWNKDLEKIDNIIEYLKKFDKVFSIIHGNTSEDGKLASLFELFNIKYVGCNPYSSIICYDKILTKLILEKYNIPIVPYQIYNEKENYKNIKYPVIIKPSKCGSSIGISVVYNYKQFKKAIVKAQKYDSKILIEKYIENNRELECAVICKKNKIIVSKVGEIIKDKWYDYNSKYISKTKTKIADINDKVKKNIQNFTVNIFKILECSDFSRIDFLFDTNNKKLYFNEINTIPGLTEISMYPKLINKIGIKNYKMLEYIIDID